VKAITRAEGLKRSDKRICR